ncbi:tetratricopeptide repeat protein [Actibacterium lipolyticum]|uniref:Tetratricopeptide repeat protein n=1 Tax=Actibacterium lipolyticum TaxID=1524263 RepID=A0A238KV23_9RHOB|nr:tetratricopeptide repeat protein [Actibacterium lipolyticum]SMX46451.1 tetratricopeptide repeat protein [Actibacterium lipolyticum]
MIFRKALQSVLMASVLFTLAACDSADERAEKHFQKGISYLASGDTDRALIEFRNVFKLNGSHLEARQTYAKLLRDSGDFNTSFSQYLRLVEQYPDDATARLALSEMAMQSQNWEEAERHGSKLLALTPDDPNAQVVGIALAYRAAVVEEDTEARNAAFNNALALKKTLPENPFLRSLLIDGLLRQGDETGALAEIDEALELTPDNMILYRQRLQILNRRGDEDAVEAQLRDMVVRFPQDESAKSLLIRFYMARKDLDSAEAFLRSQITDNEKDDAARTTFVRFLVQTRGNPEGRAALDGFIAEGTNTDLFRSLRASLDFDDGKREEALAELEDIVEKAEPSEQTREIKVTLARLLVAMGNDVGARALVDNVLEEDPGMVEALKMRAIWLIDSDQADEAITVLRAALDKNPNDAAVMTIMSSAHLRNGNRELAGELLALAVDASNNAPAESLRYAQFLVATDKVLPAEGVLLDSLRLTPTNPTILVELGKIYIRLEDWPRAGQVERSLRALGQEETTAAADQFKVAILNGQQRNEDALSFLENLARREDGNTLSAQIAIVRAHVARDDVAAARVYLDTLLEEDGDNRILRFLDAAVHGRAGELEAAEVGYRALLEEDDTTERVWLELVRTLTRAGKLDAAKEALAEGLAVLPAARDLLWAKATQFEREGDYEAAIGIYERLYDENSSTSVIANNLASLLSTVREDEESHQRAYAVARRLRGSDFPPYQDTYGWIAYQRGDYDDALRHMEPAAAALSEDPLVLYHLGMTYAGLKRYDEAVKTLQKALDVAGDDPRPAFEDARAEIERLRKIEAD